MAIGTYSQQAIAAQNQAMGLAGIPTHHHGIIGGNPGLSSWPSVGRYSAANLYHILALRMGWQTAPDPHALIPPGINCPFDTCEPRRLNDNEAVLFVIHGGEPLVFRDELNLFPSDTLITQLRLLAETTTKP